MDHWTGNKRPLNNEDPKDLQIKRRNSTFTPSGAHQPSSLQARADNCSYGQHFLDQRRLPPLYGPLYSRAAEPIIASPSQFSPTSRKTALLDDSRPRSQSLFNVIQYPHWQVSRLDTGMDIHFSIVLGVHKAGSRSISAQCSRLLEDHNSNELLPWVVFIAELITEHPMTERRTRGSDASSLHSGADMHPHPGTDVAPTTAAVICRPSSCQGKAYLNAHYLMQRLVADIFIIDTKVKALTRTEFRSTCEVSCSI
jgi:hypothetical protein